MVQEFSEIILCMPGVGAADECGNTASMGFPALVLPPVSGKTFVLMCSTVGTMALISLRLLWRIWDTLPRTPPAPKKISRCLAV